MTADGAKPDRLSQRIDQATEGHLTNVLLGMLVAQALGKRYFGQETTTLNGLVEDEVTKKTRSVIAEVLRAHEDELYDAIEARLKDHLTEIAITVADEFIADVEKGQR